MIEGTDISSDLTENRVFTFHSELVTNCDRFENLKYSSVNSYIEQEIKNLKSQIATLNKFSIVRTLKELL
jgi:hypothetical protein